MYTKSISVAVLWPYAQSIHTHTQFEPCMFFSLFIHKRLSVYLDTRDVSEFNSQAQDIRSSTLIVQNITFQWIHFSNYIVTIKNKIQDSISSADLIANSFFVQVLFDQTINFILGFSSLK